MPIPHYYPKPGPVRTRRAARPASIWSGGVCIFWSLVTFWNANRMAALSVTYEPAELLTWVFGGIAVLMFTVGSAMVMRGLPR